jgi:glucose-1-phosphate thymidylyltransferase
MSWDELDGWWTDAGTFESLLRASNMVAETGANKMDDAAAAAAPARAAAVTEDADAAEVGLKR